MLHSATRIAELYLELQQAGYVDYSAADLVFQCAIYDVALEGVEELQFNNKLASNLIVVLQDYTKEMDGKLQEWKETVHSARMKYYQLNYFTTLQLLRLRKELGLLGRSYDCHSSQVRSDVLMLLHSVSPNVNSSLVQTSVKLAKISTKIPSLSDSTEHLSESDSEEVTTQVLPDIPRQEPEDESRSTLMDSETSSTVTMLPTKVEDNTLGQTSPSSESMRPLSLEDLDDQQKQILTRCTVYLGYTNLLVLKAFQECGFEAEEYEIEQWCEDNEDDFDEEDQDDVNSELAESEEEVQEELSSEESEQGDIFFEERQLAAASLSGKKV